MTVRDLTPYRASIDAMLKRDAAGAHDGIVRGDLTQSFSPATMRAYNRVIDDVSASLQEHGMNATIERLSKGHPVQVNTGLKMLGRLVDMPAGDATRQDYQLIAADMLAHREESLRGHNAAAVYRAGREQIASPKMVV